MRVIDAGVVGAVRSQSLWHGIAAAMAPDDPAVLSFCTPLHPYVCLGYHRRLDEVDVTRCHQEGMLVLRRQIGGGPVYLDRDQLFFQLTMPVRQAPAGVERLYATLLEPAAAAFRELGLDARIDGLNDIAVGARKVSGTGAGQIGAAVTVVGNMMFRFPHERMADVLAVPSEAMRGECLRLMRRHVSSLADEGFAHVTREQAVAALRSAYESALAVDAREDDLDGRERDAVERWDRRLADPEWTRGPDLPARAGRQVKVRAGVWVFAGAEADTRVLVTVADGLVERLAVESPRLNGRARQLEAAVQGGPAEAAVLRRSLARFGEDGETVARVLEPGLALR